MEHADRVSDEPCDWATRLSPRWQRPGCDFVPGFAADAKGFEPPTSASGDQCTSDFFLRFPRFRDSAECAIARESVRFRALTGLVIPPHIVWLARHVSEDPGASVRELMLARWVLSGRKESGGG